MATACPGEPAIEAPTTTEGDELGSSETPPTTSPTSGATDPAGPGTTSTTGEPDDSTTTPFASSTGSTSASTVPSGTCGDALLDAGEGCDLGYADNHDGGPCTQSCENAVCGDGLLWIGEEQCDAGAANNNLTYNGCREDCKYGPTCGDSVLQPEHEECDPTVSPAEGVAECGAACRFNARLAFVTFSSHSGDLGGLVGADEICVAAATAAGLDRASSFLAWLSDGFDSPSERFKNAVADPTTPYARRDGKLLAGNLDQLITSGLQRTLDIDELGVQIPPETRVWTATGPDGKPYNTDACGMWHLDLFKLQARVGLASPSLEPDAFNLWKAGRHWTSYAFFPCKTDDIRLYCFED